MKKSHINQDKNKEKKESDERSRFKLCYGPVIFDMTIIDLHQKRDKKRIKSKKMQKVLRMKNIWSIFASAFAFKRGAREVL